MSGVPGNYRADIDGLRAFAVLAVMIFHARAAWLPGGFVGVDVFFVISGYLITRNILTELTSGDFSFAEFYRRRIRRIAPMMLVTVAATLFLALLIMTPESGRAVARSAIWSLASMANVHFWRDLDTSYFAPSSAEIPLLHLWSLGVEEQFYLLWPVLLVLAWRRLPAIALIAVTAAVCLLSFGLGELLFHRDASFAYYMLPSRAGELLLGAVLGMLTLRHGEAMLRVKQVDTLAWIGAALLLGSVVWLDEAAPFPGWRAMLPTFGAALLILAGNQSRGRVVQVLTLPPMRAIGKASYSAYLWHWPIFALFRYGYGEPSTPVAVLLLGLTLLLAFASYRWVEVPTRKTKRRFGPVLMRQFLLPTMALACVALPMVYAEKLGLRFASEQYLSDVRQLRESARAAYQLDWICQRRTLQEKDLEDGKCVIGAAGAGEPDILVWGDSNVAHYVPMLRVLMEHDGLRFRNIAVDACPPLLVDPEPYLERRRVDDCRSANALVATQLERYRTVVVSASWAKYQKRSEDYLAQVEAFVRALSEKGHRVVLIGRAPILEGYDWRCPIRALRVPFKSCPDLSQPLPDAVVQVNRRLRQIAASHPNTSYFDANALLCPDGICRQTGPDGKPRFFDAEHLTLAASEDLGAQLLTRAGGAKAFEMLTGRTL